MQLSLQPPLPLLCCRTSAALLQLNTHVPPPTTQGAGQGVFAEWDPSVCGHLPAAWLEIKGCLSNLLGTLNERRYRNAKHGIILIFFSFLGKWPRKVTKRDRNAKK